MHKASTAAIDSAGKEGHANRPLTCDALQGPDKVSPLEILLCASESRQTIQIPPTHFRFVSPLVSQFIKHVDLAKWA